MAGMLPESAIKQQGRQERRTEKVEIASWLSKGEEGVTPLA